MTGQKIFKNERDKWLLYEMLKKIIAKIASDCQEYERLISDVCKELNI